MINLRVGSEELITKTSPDSTWVKNLSQAQTQRQDVNILKFEQFSLSDDDLNKLSKLLSKVCCLSSPAGCFQISGPVVPILDSSIMCSSKFCLDKPFVD